MASKISSLDGRTTLWKEYMSRVAMRVGRSGFNIPIEEIIVSTIGFKSKEGEIPSYLELNAWDRFPHK
jgi:hypothetical protein